MLTASAIFQSASSSNIGKEFKCTMGVRRIQWIQWFDTAKYSWNPKIQIQLWIMIDTARKLCKTRTFISTSYKDLL